MLLVLHKMWQRRQQTSARSFSFTWKNTPLWQCEIFFFKLTSSTRSCCVVCFFTNRKRLHMLHTAAQITFRSLMLARSPPSALNPDMQVYSPPRPLRAAEAVPFARSNLRLSQHSKKLFSNQKERFYSLIWNRINVDVVTVLTVCISDSTLV